MNAFKHPLVSIITPSLNQGKFLEQTILSVLNQSYPNIEYIIIDGGSTDHSADIIKRYASRLAYWVSEKDNGQSDAINKGLKHSSGQIVAYLNSDDVYAPDAVANIVDAFNKHPEMAMIYGKCININEQGEHLSEALGGTITYYKLLTGTMLPSIHQPTCFFNRGVINRNPMFNSHLKYGMDYELILWILQRNKILFIDSLIAYFRYHSSSKTVSQTLPMYEEKMRIQRSFNKWLMPLWIWRYVKHVVSSALR